MKKVYTLFLAVMAVVAMHALPQTKVQQLKPTSSTISTPHPAAMRLAMSNLTKRAARPATQPAEQPNALKGKYIIPHAQKAEQKTVTLNGGVFLVEPEYELETREWYMVVEAEGYTFRLCWYGPADDYCDTFTVDDISFDYTWGWFQSSDLFYQIYLSDINMTISEQQIGNYLKQIIVDATLVDTEDNTYILHIVHDAYTPKSTVKSVFENTQIVVEEGAFVLDGNNDNLDITLAVNSSMIDGVYTLANLDADATKIVYNGVEQQLLQANLTVMGGTLPNGAMGYLADFSFYNQDTTLHQVSMPASLPTPKDTIHVLCTNLVVDESLADYGIISVSGSSDLYDIFVMYEGMYAEAGVYNNVSVMISDMITWEMVQSINATLTLTETSEGWHANVETYCSDYNWYSIDMQYVVPEPTDTVKIAFNTTAVASFRPDQLNMLQLLSYGEDFEAGITIYDVYPGESFTMDKVVLDYSGIYDYSVESSVAIADVKGTLNQYGDTTVITASVIGFDAVQYDVELWYAVPTPIDTVEIEMPVEFINSMDYGYYTLAAYTPDSLWYVSFSPVTDEVAGTFINDGMFGKFGVTGGAYDFYGGDTFVYSAEEWRNYTVEKGSLVVEVAPDGTIIAEAKVICANAIYYHIKMTTKYNTHLDFDEPYMEVDRIYTTEDNVTIDDQTATNGYVYLALTAADGSDMAAFFFFVEEADPDIVIPEGVYPINTSDEYGTVQANPGVQGDGVWPSFYAELSEEGSLVVPLWLLVSGTVEVKKNEHGNPYLEVNAVNSYDVPVHIVYDGGTSTGVEDTYSPSSIACKRLVNGQLLIMSNDNTYTTTGARIQ